jgi:DNA polymerase-1
VTTTKSFRSLIEAIRDSSIVCHDYETMSDSAGKYKNMEYWHPHSRIVSGSFTIADGETFVLPLSHPEGPLAKNDKWRQALRKVAEAIKDSNTKLVAHNAKYEVSWVYAMTGIALENQTWWDTMMSSYILDENETHNLKDVAVRELGVEHWADVNLKDSEKESWDALALYNARDTDYCLRVLPIHKRRLLEEPRLARLFHYLGMPIIRVLARIERLGLPLDTELVAELKDKAEETVDRLTDELLTFSREELKLDLDDYPTISFAGSTSKFFSAFMEAAELPVVSYTGKGNPSWDEHNLTELERLGFPIASKILEVRKANNRLSKFLVPWTTKVGEDKRIHATFNPMRVDDKWGGKAGTKTGRLSGSNPNPQQIARDLKYCFGNEDGWMVAELDYSQIELRILAWLSKSQQPLRAYRNNEDLHTLMAARILGIPESEVGPGDRQKGKAGNFGFSYGMGVDKYIEYAYKDYQVRIDLEEAKKTKAEFFGFWDGLARYHQLQGNIAMKYGFVRSPIGRKRRLPEIHSGQGYLIGQAERRAINSPTQSFASDLMCLSLIEIDKQFDSKKFRLIGTVHDSLLAQVRPEHADELVERAARIMLDPGTKRKFGITVDVPLAVEAKIGYRWNDPDGRVLTYQ